MQQASPTAGDHTAFLDFGVQRDNNAGQPCGCIGMDGFSPGQFVRVQRGEFEGMTGTVVSVWGRVAVVAMTAWGGQQLELHVDDLRPDQRESSKRQAVA